VGRKRETLDRFFAEALPPRRWRAIRAVCVDMWEPFRLGLQEPLPHARLVYDKFHVLRPAREAVDETRRAECFRQGRAARGLVRGKRWLLLRSWAPLDRGDRQTLRELFALTRRLAKAYLLKEQLAQLWTYTYQAAARRFLANWLRALRWQRLPAFQKLGRLLTRHLEGLLNSCHGEGPLRRRGGDQRQHPGDAAPRPRLPGPRVPAPQGPARHRHPPASGRMNTGVPTHSNEERGTINASSHHAAPCSGHPGPPERPQRRRAAGPGALPETARL